jgi:hypothetical protein
MFEPNRSRPACRGTGVERHGLPCEVTTRARQEKTGRPSVHNRAEQPGRGQLFRPEVGSIPATSSIPRNRSEQTEYVSAQPPPTIKQRPVQSLSAPTARHAPPTPPERPG